MSDRDPFGLAIEQARLQAGMSLEELGARIGKSSQTARRYELAEQRPSFQTVEKIAAHLGRRLDYFTLDQAGQVTALAEVKTTRRRGGKTGSKAPALAPVDPAVSELRKAQRLVRQELAGVARQADRISAQLRLVISELQVVSDYVADQRTGQAMQQQQETAAGRRRRRGAAAGLETPSNQPRASSAGSLAAASRGNEPHQ